MTDDDLDSIFENWARAVKDKYHETTRCRSIESNYRSPQHWNPSEARPPEIDVLSASNVEDEVRYLRNSENRSFRGYASILRDHYVFKLDPGAASRRAKINFKEYKPTLTVARLVVINRIRMNNGRI